MSQINEKLELKRSHVLSDRLTLSKRMNDRDIVRSKQKA